MSEGPARALVPQAAKALAGEARRLLPVRARSERVAVPAEPATDARLRRLDVVVSAEPRARASRVPPPLFLLLVVLPLALTAIYLLVFAAERYTSQTSFVIREGAGANAAMSPAGGLARNDDSAHAVVAYIRSRAAAADLSRDLDLRAVLSRPVGDVLTRFPRPFADDTAESLHRHLQDVVDVALDARSGIVALSSLAYRPQDAQALVEGLLGEAERLVNAMNARAAEDRIAFARSLVGEGEERMRAVQARLSEFRNTERMLDPGAQTSAQLALMTELTRSATALDTEIAQLRSSAALNPRLPSLQERRRALAGQIEAIRAELAGDSGSLAPRLGTYELLALDRELALRSLTASYHALEEARQDASASRLYLQRISAPSLPDRPSHPRSFLVLGIVAAASLSIHTVARLVLRATMEHRF